ncbi:hypothetical protein DY000_02015981 [Brassica cretica]|uniref:DUF4283 domain-containing protein n=1 Tax=Brassica cretica TaxID=69181 RepID=A0ABQ7CZR9_BRACR|nr:hypothetical protein DY000_02015981 [Brassica cretica]
MTLDIEHLEAMLKPWGNSAIVQLRPRLNMMIITDFVSNYHDWKEHFFFVCVNDASMEATFPSLGLDGVEKIFPIECPLVSLAHHPRLTMWGPSFWATILGLFRVRRAVALHHSQFRPDLPVEEGSESSMDGFVPCEVRVRKEKLRSRKEKHVITNDDVADGQCFADNILRDYLDSQGGESFGEQINLDELLDFDFLWPTADLGLLMMNRDLGASSQGARMSQFRVEMADKDIARLKDELECSRRRERGSAVTEVRRAYRRMNERDRDFEIPQIKERIWEQWEPISLSPDTVKDETGAPGETGEVNQSTAPLDVNDYLVWRLMTGYFVLDD